MNVSGSLKVIQRRTDARAPNSAKAAAAKAANEGTITSFASQPPAASSASGRSQW